MVIAGSGCGNTLQFTLCAGSQAAPDSFEVNMDKEHTVC